MDLNRIVDHLVADLLDGEEWLLELYHLIGRDNCLYRQANATRGMLESIPCRDLKSKRVQQLVSEVVD
jgi:hypothetical protein